MKCIPTPEATSFPLFIPPPLDGSLTIPEIYDFHYSNNPDHPLFIYDDGGVQTIPWRQAVKAIHRAAMMVQGIPNPHAQVGSDPPVVAILAVTDQLSYFALTAGIMRAGYRAFPISARNSDVGVANLLQKTKAKYVLVSDDRAMQEIAISARSIISASSSDCPCEIELLPVPSFDQLYVESGEEFAPLSPMVDTDLRNIAIILHSSGSTSFPKPIFISHQSILQWGVQPCHGERDICGRVLSNHSIPFFHAMGIVSLAWATMTGVIISNFAPKSPPTVSSPDSVYTGAITTRSNFILSVPSFLEEWSQLPERVNELQKFDAILFGGGPIQKAVGDMLHSKGVHLYPLYGATELGAVSMFLPKRPPSEGWEYFKISPHIKPVFLNEGGGDITFRLIVQKCPTHTPAVINTQNSDIDAYDTNDLLIRHPTNPELWKMYGRADDQIMHSNGEKTNPVPLETIINRHPKVGSAVIFGRGRFQAGVLIEPIPACAFDPSNHYLLIEFRNAIWPSVEDANLFAPSHSRIFKEMILFSSPSKPFQFTPKGTARRQAILSDYADEIERGYKAIEEPSVTEIPIPTSNSMQECLVFVRKTISEVFSTQFGDNDDFFEHGCDSLQVTWIRSRILYALRQQSHISTKDIPTNFVYLNPTIHNLSKFIYDLAINKQSATPSDAVSNAFAGMDALVDKYSFNFPPRHSSSLHPSQEAVLLTGSTGGLGSHILEKLVLDDQISRIYALNRRDKHITSRRKLVSVFEDRGIDATLLDSPKIVFLEGDTTKERLGLGDTIYEELRQNVTCIMHIAWRVDFNIALSSMEPMLQGLRRLIDFALSSPYQSPPRLLFASSIGVVKNWTEGFLLENPVADPSVASQTGYPQSKWVGERMLARAAERTELAPIIVRIGQLCGGRNGSWNTSEWVPSIVRSGQLLGCLPRADGCVTWIPIHAAASALVEMRKSDDLYLHLVHPSPVPWTNIVAVVSEALMVPLVPYHQWLSRLEQWDSNSISHREENPAIRLLDFYRSSAKVTHPGDAEAFGFPRLSTVRAVEAAPSLRPANLQPLGQDDILSWIKYWKKKGFLSNVVQSTETTLSKVESSYEMPFSNPAPAATFKFPSLIEGLHYLGIRWL